jgi:hypothetical protein
MQHLDEPGDLGCRSKQPAAAVGEEGTNGESRQFLLNVV